MIENKADALHTIAIGDQVQWTHGCRDVWGTVTRCEITWRPGVNGPVCESITLTLDVPEFPTYDNWGWPTYKKATITKTFRRGDIRIAYTPKPWLTEGGERINWQALNSLLAAYHADGWAVRRTVGTVTVTRDGETRDFTQEA